MRLSLRLQRIRYNTVITGVIIGQMLVTGTAAAFIVAPVTAPTRGPAGTTPSTSFSPPFSPTSSPVASAQPAAVSSSAKAKGVTGSAGGGIAGGAGLNGAFGIAGGSSLSALSTAELNKRLDGMRALGVGWVRFDVEWSNIGSRGPGLYDWTDYDRVAQAVVSRGLKPLGIIDYTPPWARQAACSDQPACAPADPAAYARFAGDAAAHYGPMGVHAWEIWNEPNIDVYYKPAPNVAFYTHMLTAAYPAIKAADRNALVITGGTAPTSSNGTDVGAVNFVAGIYDAGGRGAFDAVAHHPYTFPYTSTNAYPGGAWSDLMAIHSLMVSRGDGAKKVWATEYGAPTGGPGTMVSSGNGPYPGSIYVSELLQATIATQAVASYNAYGWAGPLFWYSYQDAGTSRDTVENFFGLLRADGSQKPAYGAFANAIR